MNNTSNAIGYLILGMLIIIVLYLIYTLWYKRDSTLIAYYQDGTFIKGIRKSKYVNQETHGTHHLLVTDATEKSLIGKRIAIPINSVKYFVIEKF